MPIYLLDTNAVSDLMARQPTISAKVAAKLGQLVTSVIVRGEICYGLERLPHGKRRSELQARAAHVLPSLPCEVVSEQVSDIYSRIRRTAEVNGLSCDDNDLWIAATSLVLGAVVVTRDKDFANIPGLQVEDWTV